jgi:hypothetical protein
MGPAPADRELIGLAIVVWLFLAAILIVAVRLIIGRPLGLWRRRSRTSQRRS